ncbi:MAG: hypothetical protein U5K51_08960 [Flavobacteriaceae bacterium]|nr:hypothetical protein [Flavobacteriaceae bacterium]
MLLNVSYNDKETKRKIDEEVGKPFSFLERIKMGGIGSPKLIITGASIQIQNLLILDNNRDVCNIELRPSGIIVGFRSLLETYGLIIPYYKLNLYKGQAQEYTLYRDHYFIRIGAVDKNTHEFMKKLLHYKAAQSPEQLEDL